MSDGGHQIPEARNKAIQITQKKVLNHTNNLTVQRELMVRPILLFPISEIILIK